MNKKFKKIGFSIMFGCIGFFSNGQNTLTAVGFTPIAGEKFVINGSNYADPGNSGNNQTWILDMPTLTQQVEVSYVTPSSLSLSQDFPKSNIAFDYSTAQYLFKTSNSAFQTAGVSMSGVNIVYSDLEDLIRFPAKLNDTYTDTWSATADYGGVGTLFRAGKTNVTVDGYGKLSTPDGTFSDVLRFHIHQVYKDSIDIMGQKQIIKYETHQYSWYKEGIHSTIAQVMDVTMNGSNQKAGTYINYYKSSLNTVLNEENSIYPNPVSDVLKIKSNSATNIIINDLYGKKVTESEISKGLINEIDITNLNKGFYIVTLLNENKTISSSKITIE